MMDGVHSLAHYSSSVLNPSPLSCQMGENISWKLAITTTISTHHCSQQRLGRRYYYQEDQELFFGVFPYASSAAYHRYQNIMKGECSIYRSLVICLQQNVKHSEYDINDKMIKIMFYIAVRSNVFALLIMCVYTRMDINKLYEYISIYDTLYVA